MANQMRIAAHNGCCHRAVQTRALCSALWKLLVSEELLEVLMSIEIPLCMPRGKKKKRVVEISPPPVCGRKTRGRAISHSSVRSLTTPSSLESIHSKEAEMVEQNNRNVSDYATPKLDGLQHSIRRPSIQANNFEIKLATIQLLQANGHWRGSNVNPVDAAYTLLETMSSNNHQWHSDRDVHARVARVQDPDMFACLSSQIVVLTKEVKSLGAGPSSSSRPNNPPGFNIGGFNQQARALPPPTEKKPSLEEMMMSYMSKNDALMQSQNAPFPTICHVRPPPPFPTTVEAMNPPSATVGYHNQDFSQFLPSLTILNKHPTIFDPSPVVHRRLQPLTIRRRSSLKRRFGAISKRGMFLAEENFNDVPILEVVSALKWNSFFEAPKQRGVSSIVREFYANYPDRKDGNVFVRNKLIPFDREAIKQIYKLLNVPQEKCVFRALKDEENPEYKEIAKELGCADAKPWIISSTSHKPKSIKLSKLHVDQTVKKNIPTLYFSCLITALCAKARVPWLDSEFLMDLMGPNCSDTICEAQRKKLAGPSSSSATPSSSDGLLPQLIQEQTKLIQEQSKLIEEQRKLLEDQRSSSEAQHQELVGELRLLKLRATYNTSCLDVVQANVREFIGFIANEIKFPKYQDCPPLPPEL
ncbi:helicase and polymerase-containing protein TEBICHI [Senna tora]|uniref:Helicase and polymerase-containing protein TEBICHI n=1 Tax=Senna tora TaxID=362788 RepID=A0A834WZZ0_9FABA|nr:helicase and polymerase-containing protein TEBICHI [Senna tora]